MFVCPHLGGTSSNAGCGSCRGKSSVRGPGSTSAGACCHAAAACCSTLCAGRRQQRRSALGSQLSLWKQEQEQEREQCLTVFSVSSEGRVRRIESGWKQGVVLLGTTFGVGNRCLQCATAHKGSAIVCNTSQNRPSYPATHELARRVRLQGADATTSPFSHVGGAVRALATQTSSFQQTGWEVLISSD